MSVDNRRCSNCKFDSLGSNEYPCDECDGVIMCKWESPVCPGPPLPMYNVKIKLFQGDDRAALTNRTNEFLETIHEDDVLDIQFNGTSYVEVIMVRYRELK